MEVKMKRIFKYLFLLMVFMPGVVFGSTGYITQGDNVKLEEDFDRISTKRPSSPTTG